jgi:hypothetical protein
MNVIDAFPTKILVNENANLPIDHDSMMQDIDNMIDDGTYIRSPLYQSKPVLFEQFAGDWHILQQSFEKHVEDYLSTARDQFGPPEQYEIDKTHAWFYRKDMNNLENSYANNPKHNHFPAQVVGVYHLHNPGYDGTTIYNPNTMFHTTSASVTHSVGTGGWVIFPGYLQHSTSATAIQSSMPRTVIACNAYLRVK